jgi:hypothetical protein
LCDQGTIKRVLMYQRQWEDCGDVFRPKSKGLQAGPIQGLDVPNARVSDVERDFHGFDRHFPLRNHTQERGAALNGFTNSG